MYEVETMWALLGFVCLGIIFGLFAMRESKRRMRHHLSEVQSRHTSNADQLCHQKKPLESIQLPDQKH